MRLLSWRLFVVVGNNKESPGSFFLEAHERTRSRRVHDTFLRCFFCLDVFEDFSLDILLFIL